MIKFYNICKFFTPTAFDFRSKQIFKVVLKNNPN